MIRPKHFTRSRIEEPGGVKVWIGLQIVRDRFIPSEDQTQRDQAVDSIPALKAMRDMEDEIMAEVYGLAGPDWWAYASALTDLRNGLAFGAAVHERRQWLDDFARFKGLEWSEPGRKYVVKRPEDPNPQDPRAAWGKCPHADCGAVLEWHPSENRNLCPACRQPWKVGNTDPGPLPGWRYLRPEELPERGDLAWNAEARKWEVVNVPSIWLVGGSRQPGQEFCRRIYNEK